MKTLLTLLFLPFLLAAQDFSMKLTLSSKEISLDDNLVVDLRIDHPADYTFDADILPLNLLERGHFSEPPFKILNVERTAKSATSQSFRFVLEPQMVGYHPITFFDIPFEGEVKKELISPVEFVHVISSAVSSATLSLAPLMDFDKHYPFFPGMGKTRPLLYPSMKDLAAEALELKDYKTIPWIELSVALLALLLFVLFRNYKRVLTPEQKAKQAKQKAIEQIHAMRSLRHATTGDYDSYYAAVSDIIRDYISMRYGINAPKQTTQEFLQSLKNQQFDPYMQAEIRELFMRADEVKFAGYTPSNEECAEAESTARKLVFES